MFDIGFPELVLIGIVALLVIGPERLPAVARTLGYWMGKARGFVQSVQTDLKQEFDKTDELKKLLDQQSQIKEMHEIIEQTVDETRKTVSVGADIGKHIPQPMPGRESEGKAVEVSHSEQEEKSPPKAGAVNDQAK